MRTLERVSQLREAVSAGRRGGARVGLVPTMGAFHEGHLSLMRKARADCGLVVVSLFVNPSQFAEGEDLDAYPRDLARDVDLARQEGVDLLFAPPFEEVYPEGYATTVEVAGLGETLCGAPEHRGAGHFRGVATVVTKLLNACGPDVAYFGAKDFQQTVIVKRLVRDLEIPVEIEVCPIVRDEDGLALSSRNAYLGENDREAALSLARCLAAAERAAEAGERDVGVVRDAVLGELERGGAKAEYVEVVSADDLSPLDLLEGDVLVAVAARIGRTRLIDNTVLRVRSGGERQAERTGEQRPGAPARASGDDHARRR